MTDQEILRELASAYMEAANEPVNAERRERAYATNGFRPCAPSCGFTSFRGTN